MKTVTLQTGKYKGKTAHFVCWTTPHHLSSQRRAQLKVQTGMGWITLTVNESNFS